MLSECGSGCSFIVGNSFVDGFTALWLWLQFCGFVVDGVPAVWLMGLKETIVSLMGLDHHCGSDYRIV